MATDSMKIFFCDLCNESVPQADLESGRAFMRKGRVVCWTCDRAMSDSPGGAPRTSETAGAPAAPGTATVTPVPAASPTPGSTGPGATSAAPGPGPWANYPRRSPAGSAMGWIALLAVAAVGFWLYDSDQVARGEAQRAVAGLRAEADERLDLLEARLQRATREDENARRSMEIRFDELRASIERSLEGLRRRAEDGSVRLDALNAGLQELSGLDGRIGELAGESARIDEALAAIVAEHDQLAGRVDEMAALGLTAAGMVAGRAEPEPEPTGPAWTPLLADLQSPNEGKRWTAVTSLAETEDPAVVEYLVPMLQDPGIFVRMAAARVIGDLGAPIGIPALIDALEDPEEPVRQAAVDALRQMTGRNFRFDASADEADRARKIKSWRDWWKKARDDYLGGSSG